MTTDEHPATQRTVAESSSADVTFPRDVYLEGGPLNGRIWTVEHPCFEMHFGGASVVYRVTDEPDIWKYVDVR